MERRMVSVKGIVVRRIDQQNATITTQQVELNLVCAISKY